MTITINFEAPKCVLCNTRRFVERKRIEPFMSWDWVCSECDCVIL